MKTVCKKLLCLMLVAIMLVSAVPAAFAAELITRDVSGITPVDPVDPPASPDPVVPEDEEETKITFSVNVGEWGEGSIDQLVAQGVNSFKMTEEEMQDLLAEDKYDVAEYLLSGTKYAAEVKSGNVYSIYRATGSKTVTVWLQYVGGSGSEDDPDQEENEGGNDFVPNGKVTLTIKYGYTSDRKEVVSFGTKYLSVVGEPARPGYNFMGWYSDNLDDFVGRNDKITDDDTITAIWEGPLKYSITFDVNRKGVEPIHQLKQVTYGKAIGKLPVPDTDDYVFMGWIINGKKVNANTIYEWQGDVVAYAWWEDESIIPGVPNFPEKDGNVYLEIYANGDTGDLVKRINVSAYAKDGYITRDEVKAIVAKNVVAKNGYTLKYDGLFDEETWWWYCRDHETDGSDKVKVDLWNDHYVYVMVKNVKKAVADTTNPKTGDSIMIAATTLSLSAAALVSMIELKKRKMI